MQYWHNGQWVNETPAETITQTPDLQLVTAQLIATVNDITPTHVYIDANDEPKTVILPDYANVIVYKTDASANIVTIVPQGTDTVLFQASTTLTAQGQTIHLLKKNTNWYAIG